MTTGYDAIIVGARCAGSPTAMLLARRGYRVLVVDRARFPSDTLSTHFIHPPGVAALKRWGLLDRVAATGCPAVRGGVMEMGGLRVRTRQPACDGVEVAYAVRRRVLDEILVEAARQAGAEVREGCTVEQLTSDDGRITGIRGREHNGATMAATARIVVGADGVHSLVAREVEAPVYDQHPTLTCAYYSYWSGVKMEGVELYPRPDRMIIAAPTNDGQVFVIVYWPRSEFERVRADVETNFLAAVGLAPGLATRLHGGTRTERFRGTGHLPNHFRRPYGEGWALVGDAGYHKDPILALGISDAFRDAELLAEALDAGFSGRQPLATALEGYENRRNRAAGQGYANSVQFASLAPPPPEMGPIMAALAEDEEQATRFLGTVIGAVPAEEFFSPENLKRLLGRSAPVA